MTDSNFLHQQKRFGVVFPGQGSQSVGMIAPFIDSPVVQDTFNECSEVLGFDLIALVEEGPQEQLNQTEYTQPALLAASVALWRLWQPRTTPIVLAGHSLGEYSALVCAEAITLHEAIHFVRERGRAMQSAVPEGAGAMAAILGLEDTIVENICQEIMAEASSHPSHSIVAAANYNSPGQVVVAGSRMLVETAIQKAKARGAKRALMLPVSVPSHCPLMQPALLQLEHIIPSLSIRTPKIPVLHNVDLCSHSQSKEIQKALLQQLISPVRWVELVNKMQSMGIDTVVECGPGSVLTGLNKRIVKDLPCHSITALLQGETLCH